MAVYLAFDIGGTDVKYGSIDEQGNILQHGRFSSNQADGETVLQGIAEQFARCPTPIQGVAISAPGFIDPVSGYMETGGAVHAFHHFPMKAYLEQKLEVPVSVENDVNCVALAEKWRGNAQDDTDFLCLTIGTGVGGALFLDNKLYRGHKFRAGEFGYMITQGLHNNTPDECTISRIGAILPLREKYAKSTGRSLEDVTGEDVFRAYDRKEPMAVYYVESLFQSLAICLYNLSFILNPQKILLGGAVASRATLLDELWRHLRYLGLSEKDLVLDVCRLQNQAGMIGAVYHHLHTCNQM
ncbi:ROK family protein [Brevibacillus humidisoli]|uniref:ROK family protein n=1 Tax=Brevibacillus humidisoli TaxID=2895522 RepID=UPI001E2A8E63|nr:ROK family protein [Brevibacillus humidisoli]UFJ42636.1 ROK family protein [Brevibacillus humidisoli]